MIGLHSQLLDKDEKMILKDALFLYVSDLQKRYYGDKLIETNVYLNKMKEVEAIVDKLHLAELYKWCATSTSGTIILTNKLICAIVTQSTQMTMQQTTNERKNIQAIQNSKRH